MRRLAIALACTFLVAAIALLAVWWLEAADTPLTLVIYATCLIVMSPVSFIAYALDKRAAARGNWRTKEKTLHLLDLLGGWPGGVIAQRTLRHKSYKQSFRIVLGLTIAIHLVVVGMLAYFFMIARS